jgi:4-methylaminobutanoate oxidase (formaldehyde-forming)
VTVFDESSFAKIAIEGPSAMEALSWLCANDINKPVGSLTYTQMCNDKGGIECDVTVARAGDEFFYLTTGTAFLTHDLAYITRSIPEGLRSGVAVQDMTDTYGVLGLMGPKSRVILEQAVDPAVTPVSELSNENFPFATCKPIRIAGVDVLALRITFVGELGWELHVPTFGMKQVYTALMEAGEECSIQVHNAGYRAIESLRLEKGYRVWSGEIGPDYTPLEAGLGWAVKFKSGLPFRGRDALLAQKAKPLTKLLACFTAAPDVILHGRETIYRNGERVGWLATGGFGYTVDKSIGYGYVRNPAGLNRDWVLQGDYTLEVATELVPCKVHLEPLYDPKNLKVKS